MEGRNRDMDLSSSNQDHAYSRQDRTTENIVRDVIAAGTSAASWLPVPEHFTSGDVMGFDLGEDSVRAVIHFDFFSITVLMTSPVPCMCGRIIAPRRVPYILRPSFPGRLTIDGSDTGDATEKCISEARRLLTELYCDFCLVKMNADDIRRKSECYAAFREEFIRQDRERIASLKKDIRELAAVSGQIKKAFKAGGMTQDEYVRVKSPVHDQIVKLMEMTHEMDPFSAYFSDELALCRFARPVRGMVEYFMKSS